MRAAEWKRVADVIGAVLPGFRQINLGFVRSEDWLVAGYCIESSAFSASAFYVQAFVMPRFVPAETLYFDYGFRVNGQWESVGAELASAIAEAQPALSRLATVEGLLEAARDWRINIHHAELRLCIAVLKAEKPLFDQANTAIAQFVPESDWEAAVRDRSLDLVGVVTRSGFDEARAHLAARRGDVDRVVR